MSQTKPKIDRETFDSLNFDTGDIILFHANSGIITKAIQCWTKSKYSHVGMVIKNPDFPGFKKDGLFLIESTTLETLPDVEDHKMKFGVQLHDLYNVLNTYPGDSYWRKLNCIRDSLFQKRI